MKISLRMLLWTDSLCGADEIVLCILIELLLFYIQWLVLFELVCF